MKFEELSKEEKSLLLFFETQAVEYGGTVGTEHMNGDDFEIAEKWDKNGFIKFGRICSADIAKQVTRKKTYWIELSDKAWASAHKERIERYKRISSKRVWHKTN